MNSFFRSFLINVADEERNRVIKESQTVPFSVAIDSALPWGDVTRNDAEQRVNGHGARLQLLRMPLWGAVFKLAHEMAPLEADLSLGHLQAA